MIMNKKQKKILAIALGLLSLSKDFNKESQAITALTNKEQLHYNTSKKSMEQMPDSSPNNDNLKSFSNFEKYAPQLKVAGAGMAALSLPAIIIGLLLTESDDREKQNEEKIKEQNEDTKKLLGNLLKTMVKNPFVTVIPHLVWQNSNCFFLSSLYTIFGPENYDKYEKIAKMAPENLEDWVCGWCDSSEHNDQECKDFLVLGSEERLRKSAGFIELCKLYMRMKDFAPDEDNSFQIIPEDFKNGEIEYENLICGCDVKSLDDKFKDRNTGGGPYKEVIKKFASEISPFTYAAGDESIFFEWSPGRGQNSLVNTNDFKVKIPLDRVLIRNTENGKVIGDPIEKYVEMDENGKITVDKKNYYLVSISLGEGHIYCLQPKFSIDKISNSIKVGALLHLTCFSGKDELYSCKDINDVFRNYISRGYYFRFAPESAIQQYQDYYCIKN